MAKRIDSASAISSDGTLEAGANSTRRAERSQSSYMYRTDFGRQVIDYDYPVAGNEHPALDCIAHLAHIAGPIVVQQALVRLFSKTVLDRP